MRIVVNAAAESTVALSSSARAEYAKAISIDATAKAKLRMVVLRFYRRFANHWDGDARCRVICRFAAIADIHNTNVNLPEANRRVQLAGKLLPFIRGHATLNMVAEVLPFDMRIVVDTNVLVGACLGMGTANAVVAACLNGQCVPLMGNALFNEYEDVFNRDDLFKNCKLSRRERDELLDVFFAYCEWTRVYYLWRANLPDEADNHLVELAVAGGADFIVTRNLRHLRNMQLRIASPGTFLKEI